MLEALTAAQTYLCETYERLLGITLNIGIEQTEPSQQPVWQWQSASMRNISNEEEAKGAFLADPEIGFCLFIQQYEPNVVIREHIANALRFRSRLEPSFGGSGYSKDKFGEWRVGLIWLVDEINFADWIEHIAELRQETAHFEEVPVDAIVNRDSDWKIACRVHGFPRMLLKTREVFRKQSFSSAFEWANADTIIQQKVRDLPSKTSSEIERRFADRLVEELERIVGENDEVPFRGDFSKELFRISVENFRNIRKIDIQLRDSDEIVSSNIIQGPNGSGKSSVYEAITIATTGVSTRYCEYLDDSNISKNKTPENYINDYLAPIWGNKNPPRISTNGGNLSDIWLLEKDEARQIRQELGGNFLSQAFSDNLLSESPADLGAQIAGSYSRLAGDLYDYTQTESSKAQEQRNNFNRSWGLRANVIKQDTARSRILVRKIASAFPPLSSEWSNWIEKISDIETPLLRELNVANQRLRELESGAENKLKPAVNAKNKESLNKEISIYFDEYRNSSNEIRKHVEKINEARALVLDFDVDIIRVFGSWLNSEKSAQPVTPEANLLRERLHQVTNSLKATEHHGKAVRERDNHLKTAKEFVENHWLVEDSERCPTCDTDLSDRGGIIKVLSTVIEENSERTSQLRDQYAQIKEERDKLQIELSSFSTIDTPLTMEKEKNISDLLEIIWGNHLDAPDFLTSEENQRSTERLCNWLVGMPTRRIADGFEPDDEYVNRITQEVWELFQTFDDVSEGPDAWSNVQKLLVSEFTDALFEHLPETVQALWWEIARNMMPAPWQYPGPPRFDMEPLRGRASAKVVVRGEHGSPLAAYILNGAEVHNLAVSWFLCRYLTSGRFQLRFLVLDDPAQQMDQPSFRDLCRLFESLLRLHRWHNVPLTFVAFFHQDERALDAARATNGTVHFLRWNRGTPALIRSNRLLSPSFHAPSAIEILTDDTI